MARRFNPTDGCSIINALASEALGKTTTTARDLSTFVSVGEQIMALGMDNVIKSLYNLVGRVISDNRVYKAKLSIIGDTSYGFNTSVATISYYDSDVQEDGYWNTDVNPSNLADGAKNGYGDGQVKTNMFTQRQKYAVTLTFGGSTVWMYQTTIYPDQLKPAFQNPTQFEQFFSGLLTACQNDIETAMEAWNRVVVLNAAAGTIDMATQNKMPGSAVNLVADYNAEFGTAYTRSELHTTQAESYYKYVGYRMAKISEYLEERSIKYHWSPTRTVGTKTLNQISRHTPKESQRCVYSADVFDKLKAYTWPDTYHPEFFNAPFGEKVGFWQNNQSDAERNHIKITPGIPGITDATAGQITGNAVDVYMVAMLYDVEAIKNLFVMDKTLVSPIDAVMGFQNVFQHFARNAMINFTHNIVVFYEKDAA